jgi:hypothetical protein
LFPFYAIFVRKVLPLYTFHLSDMISEFRFIAIGVIVDF